MPRTLLLDVSWHDIPPWVFLCNATTMEIIENHNIKNSIENPCVEMINDIRYPISSNTN